MNINFKLPRNIISNNILKYILYVVTLTLTVSYIINEQTLALISLILIACGIYLMNKNIIIALFISIIVTNLVLCVNYFNTTNVIENAENRDSCCPGRTFYSSNIIKYNDVIDNRTNKTTCDNLERDITANMPANEAQRSRFFSILYSNNNYLTARSICNTMDDGAYTYNMKGSLFKKSDTSSNVFENPDILPKDVLDILASSNIENALNESDKVIFENEILSVLEEINDQMFRYARRNNLQRPLQVSDLRLLTNARNMIVDRTNEFNAIKTKLILLYNSYNINILEKKTTNYTLVRDKNTTTNSYQSVTNSNGNQYILNVDQFFDCSGGVNNTNRGIFSQSDIADLSNNDYFGTSGRPISMGGLGDASYNTYGTITERELYPSNKDLEMELRRLETIPSSGNVPVNIISSYLNTINNFYEKQMQNLISNKSDVFNQETINDIYSIKTIEPTFFTYNDSYNNTNYQCQDSITGNSAFKYCGPSAFYEVPKF
jgi:hypothetical protein